MAALLAVAAAVPAAAQTFLVVPFENGSRESDLNWVGESFAESLAESLETNGHTALGREERLAALERLGLPPNGPLTRASALRLGEEAGADWVVLGRYEIESERLRACQGREIQEHAGLEGDAVSRNTLHQVGLQRFLQDAEPSSGADVGAISDPLASAIAGCLTEGYSMTGSVESFDPGAGVGWVLVSGSRA